MRESQRINNKFALITILMMSVVILIYSNYIAPLMTKQEPKILPCQEAVISFDKVYSKRGILTAYDLIKKGAFEIEGGVIYSEYMKSVLKEKIELKTTNSFFYRAINIPKDISSKKVLKIKYEIIENDKMHPNKKGNKKNCKNYAGYVLTSFRIGGSQVYRMQIDFMKYDLKEIEIRIDCTIRSFLNIGSFYASL